MIISASAPVDFDHDDDDGNEDDATDGVKGHFASLQSFPLGQAEVANGVEAARLQRRHQRHRPQTEKVEEDAGEERKHEIVCAGGGGVERADVIRSIISLPLHRGCFLSCLQRTPHL